ncbi:maleylpyruvate isomerase family mycothiol-dependent enzyme [Actinomycetospora termitidis]|uniref:Maleylpyruvate isomerase family mycothiol-dependent enzyme n=1 Tax=Actinomycetospora termitidis TaxID=3053470 RepID=A0ABT7M3X8_9PSEU|nr:maleylpyruvate isomerase family mycothiol-dependent enzyme [Actinomycetospora sp. Odt1-22]MDL5154919.1 maleylpyruvate isomerase family mycothiol-dependent enzyme [Actinomycetospora sp. Odt1-22]
MKELLRDQRLATARHLRTLDLDAWSRPSLCTGWRTREVLAHLVTPFEVSMPRMAVSMLRHRGPAGAMDVWARTLGRRAPGDLIDVLEANADSTFHPPGLPLEAPLTDVLVHTLDIRWAVEPPAVDHVDPAHVLPALEFLTTPRAVGVFLTRGRLDGIRLEADDVDFTWGEGETVRGPALALAAGACGRTPAYDLLDGEGLTRWR